MKVIKVTIKPKNPELQPEADKVAKGMTKLAEKMLKEHHPEFYTSIILTDNIK